MAPKKQQKRRKAAKRQQPRAFTRRGGGKRAQIMDCTQDYAYCLLHPNTYFDGGREVCVPDSMVMPTRKSRFRVRGSGATGTTGYGFIALNPYSPASDNACVTFTTATSVMTNSTTLNAVTNQSSLNMPCSWAAADYSSGADLQIRIVAAGVRIFYSGTKLNAGGIAYAFSTPDNEDLTSTAFTFDVVATQPTAEWTGFSGENVYCTWLPINPTDFEFHTSNSLTQFPTGIVIHTAETSQPFAFECVFYYELSGKLITSGKTASHSDPAGFGAVQQVVQNPHQARKDTKRGLLDKIGDVIAKGSRIVENVVGTGMKIWGAVESGGLSLLPDLGKHTTPRIEYFD